MQSSPDIHLSGNLHLIVPPDYCDVDAVASALVLSAIWNDKRLRKSSPGIKHESTIRPYLPITRKMFDKRPDLLHLMKSYKGMCVLNNTESSRLRKLQDSGGLTVTKLRECYNTSFPKNDSLNRCSAVLFTCPFHDSIDEKRPTCKSRMLYNCTSMVSAVIAGTVHDVEMGKLKPRQSNKLQRLFEKEPHICSIAMMGLLSATNRLTITTSMDIDVFDFLRCYIPREFVLDMKGTMRALHKVSEIQQRKHTRLGDVLQFYSNQTIVIGENLSVVFVQMDGLDYEVWENRQPDDRLPDGNDYEVWENRQPADRLPDGNKKTTSGPTRKRTVCDDINDCGLFISGRIYAMILDRTETTMSSSISVVFFCESKEQRDVLSSAMNVEWVTRVSNEQNRCLFIVVDYEHYPSLHFRPSLWETIISLMKSTEQSLTVHKSDKFECIPGFENIEL